MYIDQILSNCQGVLAVHDVKVYGADDVECYVALHNLIKRSDEHGRVECKTVQNAL